MESTTGTPYRLKVRLGSHEFEAEGTEEVVKDQFALFLTAAQSATVNVPETPSAHSSKSEGASTLGEADDIERLWNRAFKRKEDQLSLHGLPETKSQNADSLVLLIYGYHELLKQDSVQSTTLMDAAKQSGLRIDRIDRNIPTAYNQYVIRGGNGKGSRYSLNNRGLAYAQSLLEDMYES
jgi:hypothetical protein